MRNLETMLARLEKYRGRANRRCVPRGPRPVEVVAVTVVHPVAIA